MAGITVGELTGEGVTDFVGVDVAVGFGEGVDVDLAGVGVVLGVALAGGGVAVTVTVAVAAAIVERDAGVLAGVATTADDVTGVAGSLDAGAAKDAAGLGGLLDAGAAWCELDEHADSSTVIDAPATIARRHFIVGPLGR
jgi:hypothetical protein